MSYESPRSTTFSYVAQRPFVPDPRPPAKLPSQRWAPVSMGHTLSQRLPHLLREKSLDIGKTDKVFASEWITEEEVVVGTKCNKVRGTIHIDTCFMRDVFFLQQTKILAMI